MEINSLKELFIQLKTRLLTFLGNTAFNINSIEGASLGILVHIYPTHSIALVNFFVTYLFFKPSK